jgi:hypothetical protein
VRSSYNSTSHTSSQYTVTELHVGGRSFDVPQSLPDAMMQGDVYAVYYADFGPTGDVKKEVISAELVSRAGTVPAAAPAPAAPLDDDEEILDALRNGNKIEAIKRYRELTDAGLADAKAAVEDIAARNGL